MAELSEELLGLLKDTESIKVVGTIDGDGIPHLVVKGSLTSLDDKTIVFVEGFEGSFTNENLIRSVALDKKVAINITKGLLSYQVKGRPHQYIKSDLVFQQMLSRIRERRGPDAVIAGVWAVIPEVVRNESPGYRAALASKEAVSHQDSLKTKA
jgi:hypothetical protein